MSDRWDETWHRLLTWTNGQAPSERLSAQVLISEGYKGLDPSHPLGGRDGGKDALCQNNGEPALMAVYFPKGQKKFTTIKSKFRRDFKALSRTAATEFVFVTNQQLSLGERDSLRSIEPGTTISLYHLCLLYTSPSPRDRTRSRMPSSA